MLTKSDLRQKSREWVPATAKARAALSLELQNRLRKEPQYQRAQRIGLFAGLPVEVDLLGLWEPGSRFFFPKVVNEKLEFGSVTGLDDLVPGYAGILEPPQSSPVPWASDDIILVPGKVFDRSGRRLGSGKGFYDSFLPHCPAKRWGVCWEGQLHTNPIPVEPHDIGMDLIVTPRETLRIE